MKKIQSMIATLRWMSLGLTSLGFIGLPLASEAIVIRDDVPDEHYHASVADFPPLVTLYNIGVHGTLIHPNWFVTAAHAVFCMNPGQQVLVGQQVATVEGRYSHPDYTLGGKHDLALIRLREPVTAIAPALLYQDGAELGTSLWFIGAGGSGTGRLGETINYRDNNGRLRKAQNRVVEVTDTDIVFKFERGAAGEALEGVSGNGDSGGPAFVKQADHYVLMGVSSRTDSWFYGVGEYGVTELYTRISAYRPWIERVMASTDESQRRAISSQDPFLQDNMTPEAMPALCAKLDVAAR